MVNKIQERKAEVLAGIGLSWLCMTKKKTIWRSDLIEIMEYFNYQERIDYKEFMYFPMIMAEEIFWKDSDLKKKRRKDGK